MTQYVPLLLLCTQSSFNFHTLIDMISRQVDDKIGVLSMKPIHNQTLLLIDLQVGCTNSPLGHLRARLRFQSQLTFWSIIS